MEHAASNQHEDEIYSRKHASRGLVEPKYMGTLADQRDMNVLGRVQVLRVSPNIPAAVSSNDAVSLEKLPIYLYCWVWLHADLHVGSHTNVGFMT
jgi:hypothetical protein